MVTATTPSLPSCVSTIPTLFDMASSLPLVVEFVLQVLRSISGVFRIVVLYLWEEVSLESSYSTTMFLSK